MSRQLTAHHRAITDACRYECGDAGACDEAMYTATKAVREALEGWPRGKRTMIHIRVEIEYE